MPELSKEQKDEIIRRRGNKSDKTGVRHPISNLEIHHKNRNPKDNNPRNIRVLTPKKHDELHKRPKICWAKRSSRTLETEKSADYAQEHFVSCCNPILFTICLKHLVTTLTTSGIDILTLCPHLQCVSKFLIRHAAIPENFTEATTLDVREKLWEYRSD